MATVEIDPADVVDIIGVAQQCDYAKGKDLVNTIVNAAMYDLKNQFPDPKEADRNDVYDFVYEVADGSLVYTMDQYNVVFYIGDEAAESDFVDWSQSEANFDGFVATMAIEAVQLAIFDAALEAGYDV